MFTDHFEVFLADTPESKEINYSIRYQVYCEEMGFENKNDFPLKKEFDENDDEGRSVHFIVKNKKTKKWVGAMRLIFKQDTLLPIEKNCKLDEKINIANSYGVVELSRLCLLKDIRRGFKDIDPPNGIAEDKHHAEATNKILLMPSRQKFNRMVLWGLLHAAVDYGYSNNILNSYFMTTKALAKVLRRNGLNLINIGNSCQYKGERLPFRMDTIEAYHSEVWKREYSRGYRLFSEPEETCSFVA